MDETYQTYLNRAVRLTLPATYESQLQNIQESPKFQLDAMGIRRAVSFPGYSAITPPWEEDPDNTPFYTSLKDCQQQLVEQLGALMVPVPEESFHLTLADLIWDNAYLSAIKKNPEFEKQFQEAIAQSFEQYKRSFGNDNPPIWQLLGIILRPRAIAVGLVPKDENSYRRILDFRRSIYQNPKLLALGLEQQYHFTAHITLGYFGEIPPDLERDRLNQILSDINLQWISNSPPELLIHRVELRKFDDMMRYYQEPGFPALEF